MSANQLINPMVKWLLVGTAGYSLGSVITDPLLSVAATVGATICVVFGLLRRVDLRIPIHVLGGMLTLGVVVLAKTSEITRFSLLSGSYTVWFLLAIATGISVFFAPLGSMRRVTIIFAILTVVVGSLTILIPNWQPSASSDVFRAHTAAGEALVAGENPYTDAVVFESGDPYKSDRTLIEGYPYPTPPLATYGSLAVITDPRLISLACWLIVMLGLSVLAARRDHFGTVALVVLAVTATLPVWRMTLFMSWTEPLSIGLLGVSLIGISKQRRWGWVVLGIALASKQYLVFLAPLALLYRDREGRRPGWVALAVSAVVAGFPALFGFSDYFRSVIGNALDIGFRPDTQSINGAIASLGGDFLIPIAFLVPLMACLIIGAHKIDLPRELLPAVGVVVLALALLTTSAFPNYWMFVTALAGFSVLTSAACKGKCAGESSTVGYETTGAGPSD